MQLHEISKNELSLLLFFETCAVDRGGLVDIRRMNEDDVRIAKNWSAAGFVGFGRVKYDDIKSTYSHWCELSDEAWTIAHQGRRLRCARLTERREWRKVDTGEPAPGRE